MWWVMDFQVPRWSALVCYRYLIGYTKWSQLKWYRTPLFPTTKMTMAMSSSGRLCNMCIFNIACYFHQQYIWLPNICTTSLSLALLTKIKIKLEITGSSMRQGANILASYSWIIIYALREVERRLRQLRRCRGWKNALGVKDRVSSTERIDNYPSLQR